MGSQDTQDFAQFLLILVEPVWCATGDDLRPGAEFELHGKSRRGDDARRDRPRQLLDAAHCVRDGGHRAVRRTQLQVDSRDVNSSHWIGQEAPRGPGERAHVDSTLPAGAGNVLRSRQASCTKGSVTAQTPWPLRMMMLALPSASAIRGPWSAVPSRPTVAAYSPKASAANKPVASPCALAMRLKTAVARTPRSSTLRNSTSAAAPFKVAAITGR